MSATLGVTARPASQHQAVAQPGLMAAVAMRGQPQGEAEEPLIMESFPEAHFPQAMVSQEQSSTRHTVAALAAAAEIAHPQPGALAVNMAVEELLIIPLLEKMAAQD